MNRQPNILILQADQHRADCIGVYGNKDVKTPNIDNLAKDGVLYTQSFCPYPVCTPSRYSFLSGLYVRQHLGGSNHCTLPAGLPTFPKLLREAGYRTKAVGKMHLTPTYADVGFDELILAEQNGVGRYDDDYHRWLKAEGLNNFVDLLDQEKEYRRYAPAEYWDNVGAMVSDLDEVHHSTTWIGDRAAEEVSGWNDEGQLLMTSFIKPHHPFDPPDEWAKKYNADDLSLLPGYTPKPTKQDLDFSSGYFPYDQMSEEKIRQAMAYYYALISQIDFQVGRLIKILKQKALYDDTLIIYNSDHGDYMGHHHLLLKGNYMYDPLIRVPLIIKFPKQFNAGSVDSSLINNIDIAPTILNQAQIPTPKSMYGKDVLQSEKSIYVFAESGQGQSYMVRSKTHKLLLCREDKHSQFFDLQNDPYELNNLYAKSNELAVISEMKNALARWALFEAPYPIHTDELNPTIHLRKSRGSETETRGEIYSYFEKQMTERLNS